MPPGHVGPTRLPEEREREREKCCDSGVLLLTMSKIQPQCYRHARVLTTIYRTELTSGWGHIPRLGPCPPPGPISAQLGNAGISAGLHGSAVVWVGRSGGDLLVWVLLVGHWVIYSIFKLVTPPPRLATTSEQGATWYDKIKIGPVAFLDLSLLHK